MGSRPSLPSQDAVIYLTGLLRNEFTVVVVGPDWSSVSIEHRSFIYLLVVGDRAIPWLIQFIQHIFFEIEIELGERFYHGLSSFHEYFLCQLKGDFWLELLGDHEVVGIIVKSDGLMH